MLTVRIKLLQNLQTLTMSHTRHHAGPYTDTPSVGIRTHLTASILVNHLPDQISGSSHPVINHWSLGWYVPRPGPGELPPPSTPASPSAH